MANDHNLVTDTVTLKLRKTKKRTGEGKTKISERKTKQKINATRSQTLKDRLKSRYAELNREVKRMAQVDKKSFMEGLAEEAEEAARKQDLKTLYRLTKNTQRWIEKQ